MITFRMNGLEVKAEEGSTLLEAAKFFGLEIPTLCHMDGLTPLRRLPALRRRDRRGPEEQARLVLHLPGRGGARVRTASDRVWAARRMMIELLLAMAPGSKILQDLASPVRRHASCASRPATTDCILCGLCVRMCEEQMDARAIGFQQRGEKRKISTPFDMQSEVCRLCGGLHVHLPGLPAPLQVPSADTAICSGCLTMEPPCLDHYDDMQCWMYDAGRCGTCVQDKRNLRGSSRR